MKTYLLVKDNEVYFQGTENECLRELHKLTSCSWHYAFKYEGWRIEPKKESEK